MAIKKIKYEVKRTSSKPGKALQARLASLQDYTIAVGLPADKIHNAAKMPVSELGAIHEFGLPEAGIPERSFLRSTIVDKAKVANKMLQVAAANIAKGADAETELNKIALWLQGAVQQRIVDIQMPPKAESTLRAYARTNDANKTNPLIKSGEMRQSVIGVVVRD